VDVAAPTLDPGPFREAVPGEPLQARWLGRMAYRDAWALQHELVEGRVAGRIPDQLLLLEHPAVLTLGRNADEGHVRASLGELAARGIELIRVERGGEVTYHGPGQLVAYPILALSRRGLLVRPLVRALEAAMAATCAAFGVEADRREGHPGCWCGVRGAAPRKIGALGIRVERGVSYHGVALNVDPDLTDFDLIDACGMPGVVSTSIARELGLAVAAELAVDADLALRAQLAVDADLGFPRTARANTPSGDARRGITPENPDLTFPPATNPNRFDAPEGIRRNQAYRDARLRTPIADSGAAAIPAAAEGAPVREGLVSPDAPSGIGGGADLGGSERESNPLVADAPRGIAGKTSPAGSNVIWAAQLFARTFADHLGAELQGFGADAAGKPGAAGTHGAGAAARS
jgi:lipoyl(octanoyl) transferase